MFIFDLGVHKDSKKIICFNYILEQSNRTKCKYNFWDISVCHFIFVATSVNVCGGTIVILNKRNGTQRHLGFLNTFYGLL